MAEPADYYSLLSRFVARLGCDSFEARGAIYDRARIDLVKRSAAADPPWSDEELEREHLALLEAIRRIEFEDLAPRRIADAGRPPTPPQSVPRPTDPNRPASRAEQDALESERAALLDAASARVDGQRPKRTWFEWNTPEDLPAPPNRAEPAGLERLRPDQIRPERERAEWDGVQEEPAEAAAPAGGSTRPRAERSGPDYALGEIDRVGSEAPTPSAGSGAGGAAPSRIELPRPEPVRPEPLPPSIPLPDEQRPTQDRIEPPRPARPGAGPPQPGLIDLARTARPKVSEFRAQEQKPPERKPTVRAGQKPMLRRIAGRMVLALVLIGIGSVILLAAQSERIPKWLAKFSSSQTVGGQRAGVDTGAQRATLFDGDPTDPASRSLTGSARWSVRAVPGAAGTQPDNVVTLDVEIPERELELTVTISPDPDKSALSHLVEFQFKPSPSQPPDAVANILGLHVKKEERERGTEVAGRVVKVAPGAFLLGLSGLATDIEQNARLLKGGQWLDIPIIQKDGGRLVLSIEIGKTGASALEKMFPP